MKTSFVSLVRGSARHVRKFGQLRGISITCFPLLALFVFSCVAFEQRAFGATPESAARAVATAIAGENAQLNGKRLIPGATLFPGDVVTLGADSSAAMQIRGKNDLVIATPGTALVIESEGVRLRTGRVRIRLAGEDTLPVSGPFFHVSVAGSGGNSGSAEISTNEKSARVATVTGVSDILMDGSDALHRVDAGKIAVMDDAASGDIANGKDSSLSAAGEASNSAGAPATPPQKTQPSGASRKTIYIISAAVGGTAIGVGLWLSSREMVSPQVPVP
jgi:hypothetical protein